MSNSSKTRRHAARMRARRAAKAAKAAAYAALKGTSRKAKKIKARSQAGWSSHKHRHLVDHCGNVGCSRCYPQFARKIQNGRLVPPM